MAFVPTQRWSKSINIVLLLFLPIVIFLPSLQYATASSYSVKGSAVPIAICAYMYSSHIIICIFLYREIITLVLMVLTRMVVIWDVVSSPVKCSSYSYSYITFMINYSIVIFVHKELYVTGFAKTYHLHT